MSKTMEKFAEERIALHGGDLARARKAEAEKRAEMERRGFFLVRTRRGELEFRNRAGMRDEDYESFRDWFLGNMDALLGKEGASSPAEAVEMFENRS